jgi:hypothetical protein
MDDRELALMLFAGLEELYLRTMVQQAVLDVLTAEEDDWRARAEYAEILQAPLIRAQFDKLRSDMFGVPQEVHPAEDWDTVVRRILDKGKA